MEFEKSIKWAIAIICCIGIILAIALPVASLKSLDPTEVGLDYSTTSISMDETQLYSAGRHFIGVAHQFIVYNTQYQRIEMDNITCRSSDGLNIQISAGFQYQLKSTLGDILDLFYLWPWAAYEGGYRNIAINIFRDVVSNYTAFELVYNRTVVESSLVTFLQASLINYHATVTNFQLLDVEFPTTFSSAISDTQNANLSIQAAIYNQSTVQNQVAGQILKAQTDAVVIVNSANISATMTFQKAEGELLSTTERINRQISSLNYTKNSLGFSADAIIAYEWLKSLENIAAKNILRVNLKTPPIIECLHSPDSTCSGL